MHYLAAFAFLFSAVELVAQCPKPRVPAGGFATAVLRDQALTYSDGYKTLYHLTYPQGTPPPCGWPLVVHVHGYGGARSVQSAIARHGFAVAAQDVRGQGAAKGLNPGNVGMTFYGATEKFDLAELIQHVTKTHANLVAPDRVAVTGASQGGIHSWFAAAYSGRNLTIAGRGTIRFPDIDCVVPQNFAPDALQHALRDDTLVSLDVLGKALGAGGAVLDPGFVQKFRSYWLSQDIAGLALSLRQEPGREVAPLLPQSRVPIQCAHAWLDGVQSAHELVEVLGRMPSTVPVQALLSTIGHQSPGNDYEAKWRHEQRLRWFDRYLWNVPNGVELEHRYQLAVLPVRESARNDARYLWQRRFDASAPASDVRPEKLYLHPDGTLQDQEPAQAGKRRIRHQVPASFTASHLAASPANRSTQTILRSIPISEHAFRTKALTEERELGGSPKISLRLIPNAERFTICALLMAHVPGETRAQALAHWARGVLGARANVPMRLEFELSPAVHVLPAGTTLELVLRNHWLREPPFPPNLVTAPYLTSSDVDLQCGAQVEACWIELPFRAGVRPGLVAATNSLDAARPADLDLELRCGAACAGRLQLTVASLSGQTPPVPLPGGSLPLRWDPMTEFGLALANGPAFPGFIGLLDPAGNARMQLRLRALGPLPVSLAGHRLSLASWVLDGSFGLQGAASNPIDVHFR